MASPSNHRSFIILHKFKASCLTDSSAIETTVPSKSSSRQTALPSRDPRRKNRLGTQLGIAYSQMGMVPYLLVWLNVSQNFIQLKKACILNHW